MWKDSQSSVPKAGAAMKPKAGAAMKPPRGAYCRRGPRPMLVWVFFALTLLAVPTSADPSRREWTSPFPSGATASNCHPVTPVVCSHAATSDPTSGLIVVSGEVSGLVSGRVPGRGQAWADAVIRASLPIEDVIDQLSVEVQFDVRSVRTDHSGRIHSLDHDRAGLSGNPRVRLLLLVTHTACPGCAQAETLTVEGGTVGQFVLSLELSRGPDPIPAGQLDIQAGVDAVAALDGLLPDNGTTSVEVEMVVERISVLTV